MLTATIAKAGIGLTNASYKPLRAEQSRDLLTGQAPTEDVFNEAATAAAAGGGPGKRPARIRRLQARHDPHHDSSAHSSWPPGAPASTV